jgi:HEAT repeat protein
MLLKSKVVWMSGLAILSTIAWTVANRPPAPKTSPPVLIGEVPSLEDLMTGAPVRPVESGAADGLVARVLDKTEDKLARQDAVRKIAALPANVSVPVLRDLLRAQDRDTVEPITSRNFGIGVAPGFVPALAAEALGTLGTRAADASMDLVDRLLRDERVSVRLNAGVALSRIAPHDPRVVAAFAAVLDSRDTLVWSVAVFGLGEAGDQAAAGVPALKRLASTQLGPGPLPSLEICNAVFEARRCLARLQVSSRKN